jgi:uncharacterized protein (DUF2235 family)
MPERIVVLSDGTGNSSAKVWRTNVWRTFEFLDLTSPEQVAMYDDGVGTSAFLPLALLGGALGWGLKRNDLSAETMTVTSLAFQRYTHLASVEARSR